METLMNVDIVVPSWSLASLASSSQQVASTHPPQCPCYPGDLVSSFVKTFALKLREYKCYVAIE